MRIVCPACAAAYDLADGHVTSGQVVRCARCGGEWVPVTAGQPELVSAAEVEAPPDHPLEPDPLPPSLATRPSPIATMLRTLKPSVLRHASAYGAMAAWGLSVVLLVALAWAAVNWRADIMRFWPPSTRLYAAIGLPGR